MMMIVVSLILGSEQYHHSQLQFCDLCKWICKASLGYFKEFLDLNYDVKEKCYAT